ncbi:MAG TPA: hypothetical protein VFI23_15535 [Rhizomicrobium sp.]|nr:hypothetical protein [Rhizomicrobium sp.]
MNFGGMPSFLSRYGWLLGLLLVPFLAGGVVVGDEAVLLKSVHGLDSSSLGFGAYARGPDGWYITHHVLWFGLIYLTVHALALLHAGNFFTEAVISCQTVIAGLGGVALCHRFLIRKQRLTPPRGLFTVLAFFVAGYGVYTFCMAGVVESYMTLVMAARLFFVEQEIEERDAWKLALLDILLVTLKIYSLIFLAAAWPFLRFSQNARRSYVLVFGPLLLALAGVKLWLWNPFYAAAVGDISVSQSLARFGAQFFSPWTGLLFCLPVLLVLPWTERSRWKALGFKILGLCGCAAFFSLYDFFNGDLAGGRYIFPFVVALLPEVAGAVSRLLDRRPRLAWLLPAAVLAFLPVAGLGYPFFPTGAVAPRGPCHPDHPVIWSWEMVAAKIENRAQVEICFHRQKYLLSPRDAASPHLGPWRVAYMLEGGHSLSYRAVAHDSGQKQHDAWGALLAERLGRLGLGDPWLWRAMGSLPALLALWLSLWTAIRLNSPVTRNRTRV